MVPPRAIREGPQVDLMCPCRAVLLCEVEVCLRYMRRQDQPVMFLTSRLPQFLKLFRSKHFTERIWRVHRTVDHDMGDMNAFGGKFGVERLAEHPPTSHRPRLRRGIYAAHSRDGHSRQTDSAAIAVADRLC